MRHDDHPTAKHYRDLKSGHNPAISGQSDERDEIIIDPINLDEKVIAALASGRCSDMEIMGEIARRYPHIKFCRYDQSRRTEYTAELILRVIESGQECRSERGAMCPSANARITND